MIRRTLATRLGTRVVPAMIVIGAASLLAADAPTTQPAHQATDEAKTPSTTQPVASSEFAAQLAVREQLTSGLIGSKHDFRHLSESIRDLCLPCHTPHLVSPEPPRLDQRPPTTQPLRPYQTPDVELDGWSLLCLGCHDGVTAQDVYSSHHALTVTEHLANSQLNLVGLRSHPVGVRYPRADEDYNAPAAVEAAGLRLPDRRIQCVTCHDAHNTHGHESMLKVSNRRSQMCLTCHRR